MIPTVLNLAIVDDDDATRGLIAKKLSELFHSQSVQLNLSSFASAKDYYNSLKNHSYNLTFLDIEMPAMDGISLASKLLEEGRKDTIIYVSNREDRVFDSLETHPFGFVRKSHFQSDIDKVIANYIQNLKEDNQNYFVLNSGKDQITLALEDIVYIESIKKKQLFHKKDQKEPLVTNMTMQAIMDELKDKGFIECHKGVLVNYRYIQAIMEDYLLLKDGSSLPLSRRKTAEVKEKYLSLMQDRFVQIY